MKKYYILFIEIFTIYFIVSCSASMMIISTPSVIPSKILEPQEISSIIPLKETSTFTLQSISTSNPTSTRIVPEKEIPTLGLICNQSAEQMEKCIKQMITTNNGCKYPCVWGITPENTSINRANEYLLSFGIKGNNYDDNEYGKQYSYQLITKPAIIGISFSGHEKVELIAVESQLETIAGTKYTYYDQIFDYLPKTLFDNYGKPDNIYIYYEHLNIYDPNNTIFTLMIFYKRMNFLLDYGGYAERIEKGYRICPMIVNETNYIERVKIMAKSSIINKTLESMTIYGDPERNTIDKMSTTTTDKFYNDVKDDKLACIDTTDKILDEK